MTGWSTEITSIKKNEILVKGYPIEQIMEKVTFTDLVFLILKGELPGIEDSKIFSAVLTSSVDHGATPPSCLATLNSASTGAPLNAALASGLLSINNFHGGAIENAMKLFREFADELDGRINMKRITEMVSDRLSRKVRFSGFGHRVHSEDPRSIALREICLLNLPEERLFHIKLATSIEEALSTVKGTRLPLNVDGMIGAVLLTLDFPEELANGIFMISRLPGLMAHYFEEKRTQKPMRRIDQAGAEYVGPSRRDVL